MDLEVSQDIGLKKIVLMILIMITYGAFNI